LFTIDINTVFLSEIYGPEAETPLQSMQHPVFFLQLKLKHIPARMFGAPHIHMIPVKRKCFVVFSDLRTLFLSKITLTSQFFYGSRNSCPGRDIAVGNLYTHVPIGPGIEKDITDMVFWSDLQPDRTVYSPEKPP